jgi:hypothetical protein
MPDRQPLMETLEARARRRDSRRDFFTQVAGAAAIGATAFAASAQAQTSPSPTPTATFTEADVLNFALNLEYLEANFYSFAATGAALAAADTSGSVGTAGAATGGRAVGFKDALVAQYAREIAADELAHVRFLRSQFSDTTRAAQPAIDLSVSATSAFSVAARAAGLIQAGQSFDPYASDENFLLGAFIFEDVGVTAYKGAAPLISNKVFVEAAAGILAVEAYHAAIIRSVLYRKGLATPSLQLIEATTAISDARDTLDGKTATTDAVRGIAAEDDQGIASTTTSDGTVSNIVPLNENGIAYSRSAGQTLNIVYLNAAAVSSGGFFPAGVNGNIKTSAASA